MRWADGRIVDHMMDGRKVEREGEAGMKEWGGIVRGREGASGKEPIYASCPAIEYLYDFYKTLEDPSYIVFRIISRKTCLRPLV